MPRHDFYPCWDWIIFQINAEPVLVCKKVAAIIKNHFHHLPTFGWRNLQNIAMIVKLLYWPAIFKEDTDQALLHISGIEIMYTRPDQTRLLNFDQISKFRAIFWISTKFQNIYQISEFLPNFRTYRHTADIKRPTLGTGLSLFYIVSISFIDF